MGVAKLNIFILVTLICAFAASAVQITELKGEISNASSQISDFFYDVPREDFLIITGSKVSIEEKIIFNMLKANSPEVQGIQIEPDTYAISMYDLENRTLILLGSDRTNLMSKKLVDENRVLDSNRSIYDPFIMACTKLVSGKKALVFFSEKELMNAENSASEKSPFTSIMDKKYVPVAATFLSVLLLYLWSIFGKFIMSIFSDFSSSKVIQRLTHGKKVKKKDPTMLKLHEYIDASEMIALAFTTFIFAITMSWSWSSNIEEFKKMFLINLIVVGLVCIIREGVRQAMCYRHKIRSEYVFWPVGSIITLVSTVLGNTFSLVSYTVVDDKADEKKLGRISFFISFFTYISAVIAYVLNILSPSLVLQMIFVYCLMTLFIELFPMAPFAGNDIRKWRFPVWIIFYMVVAVSYVLLNFTAYV